MEFAIGGLLSILVNAVQIAVDIVIHFFAGLLYGLLFAALLSPIIASGPKAPDGLNDPFLQVGQYCTANNSEATYAYQHLLNNSAAFAILVGCNESLQVR
jgi:hypothetical protein